MKVLVTGGARSGKSNFAERLCMKLAPAAVYIATAQAFDDEMRTRIELHQHQRTEAGYLWETIEEPEKLAQVLATIGEEHIRKQMEAPAILIDCLTLWLSNQLLRLEGRADQEEQLNLVIQQLLESIRQYPGLLIMVTNEVGDGVVPSYPLGRLYRDLAGRLNQWAASQCDQVFLVTAGIPIELKSREYKL